MTPTHKGLYTQYQDCKHKINEPVKHPCSYSHSAVRHASGVKHERDFTVCRLKEIR